MGQEHITVHRSRSWWVFSTVEGRTYYKKQAAILCASFQARSSKQTNEINPSNYQGGAKETFALGRCRAQAAILQIQLHHTVSQKGIRLPSNWASYSKHNSVPTLLPSSFSSNAGDLLELFAPIVGIGWKLPSALTSFCSTKHGMLWQWSLEGGETRSRLQYVKIAQLLHLDKSTNTIQRKAGQILKGYTRTCSTVFPYPYKQTNWLSLDYTGKITSDTSHVAGTILTASLHFQTVTLQLVQVPLHYKNPEAAWYQNR